MQNQREMPTSTQRRLEIIDALRGVAVLLVIATHTFGPLIRRGDLPVYIGRFPFSLFMPLVNGTYAVQLFFLLSGFVLYLPYAQGRRHMRGIGNAVSYLRHRAYRLLPLFWLSFLVPMFLYFGYQSWDVRMHQLVAMFTFTFPFTREMFLPPYNYPLWSLGVEIWLSLLLPLIIIIIRRMGIRTTMLFLLLISVGTRLFAVITSGTYGTDMIISSPWAQLDCFGFGIVVAHLYTHAQATRPLRDVLCGSALVLAGGFFTDWASVEIVTWESVPFAFLMVNAGFALVVHGLLHLRHRRAVKLFANPLLCQLGIMCYSLYVWHVPILSGLSRTLAERDPVTLSLCAVTLLVVGTLSYRYVEFGHVADTRSLFVFPKVQAKRRPRRNGERRLVQA